MQREDTVFDPIVVKNSPSVNEDLFITKENHLLFILRVIKTF